jgi:hypothetical protein
VIRRPINQIAADIVRDWTNVAPSAKPYLAAMQRLQSIKDWYGADDAETIVLYFLANAATWRSPVARQIKRELRELVKSAAPKGSPFDVYMRRM